jgi:hypothetical protein
MKLATGKKEIMDNHQDIIDRIKATPAIEPPASFTDNVMRRLPDYKPSILFRIWQALLRPREFDFSITRVMAGSAGNSAECAFSFFIIGFFYLIMGLVLLMGLQGFIYEATITQWIKMQPQIVMATSLWLMIHGVAILLDGKIAVKMAEWGTLIFIGFAIINGSIIASNTNLSIFFAVAFAGTGLMMGTFLGFTIERYQNSLKSAGGV